MTFVRGDAAAAAKALRDFRRATAAAARVQGRLDERRARSAPERSTPIAQLPSREVLYGRLVGMVASPLTGLATRLGGLIGGLARQLQQIADQGLVGGEAPAAPAEAAPSPLRGRGRGACRGGGARADRVAEDSGRRHFH